MAEKVPRLLPGVDFRKLKLDPTDGFLMTRIDGKLSLHDLARETGLPEFSITRTLEKLEKLGVIDMAEPNAPPPVAPPPPPPPMSERKSTIAQFDDGLLAPKYDPAELDETADLAIEQKKRILDFYYRLDDLDHYTLLGLTQEADKKGVKRAYHELAAAFHPDRFFRKQLGAFKPKMEILFARVTEAHDTLVDPTKRAEYDAYLAEVATTRGMEAMLERAIAESTRAAAEAEKARASAASAVSVPPPVTFSEAPAPIVTPPPTNAPSAEEIQRRKDALARRLTGAPRPTTSSRPPAEPERPNPLKYTNTQDAVDALKRRYEHRIESATLKHAQTYVVAAEQALAKNDIVSAATAFGIAVKFSPDDLALAARAKEVKVLADQTLAESYLKQAQYEERQLHWEEAAKSWSKVAKIRDDAHAHERAANALHRCDDADLRAAAEHAKRAIALQPDKVDNHVTLVEIYFKAGLATSAKRAAETATQIDAKHAPLLALLKKIQKT